MIVNEHGRPFETETLSERSIENPVNPLSEPEEWLDMLGGGKSSSGVRVNTNTSLMLGAFWRGVNVVARDVAKIQIVVYKRKGEGKERATEHPAYKLLRNKVCPEMVSFEFKRTRQAHAMMNGNGYGYIVRFGDGTPKEIWPLSPVDTYPVRANGQLLYITHVDGELRKLPYQDVLHVKGLGFDGFQGYSVISKAAESIGMGLAATKHTSIFFANAARPSVVLETPGKFKNPEDMKRLRTDWERLNTGLDNHHKTAILDQDMHAKVLSVTARDAQLQQILDWNVRDIANWIGIPAHKLGNEANRSFNSLEQDRQDYLDDALDGWFVTWEQEAWDKLLSAEEKDNDTHIIEFMRQALLRADLKARGEFYAKATGGVPWMLPDEVRAKENEPPIPGGEGSVFRVPVTIAEPDEEDDDDDGEGGNGSPAPFPSPPAGDGDDDDEDDDEERKRVRAAHEALLDDRVQFILRRIGRDAERAAKTPGTFCTWLDQGIDERHGAFIEESLAPVFRVCMPRADEHGKAKMGRRLVVAQAAYQLNKVAEHTSEGRLASAVGIVVAGDQWSNTFTEMTRGIVWSNENVN